MGWMPNVRIPGQKSKSPPGLAFYQNRVYMVHRGSDENDIWMSIFNGADWVKSDGTAGNDRIPGQRTKLGPALAVYNNNLYMVHGGGMLAIGAGTTASGQQLTSQSIVRHGSPTTGDNQSPAGRTGILPGDVRVWELTHGHSAAASGLLPGDVRVWELLHS